MASVKNILIVVLMLSSLHNVKGQASGDKLLYYDKNWKECSKDSASYYRIIENYYSKRKVYEVTDYFITGEKQMEGKYIDPDTEIKKGTFTWYYRNGNKKSEINYDRTPIGKYYKWYEDGSPKVVGYHIENKTDKRLPGLQKIISFWDSTGVQLVMKGSGTYYESDKKRFETGKVLKGFKHGKWEGYDPDVKVRYEEEYAKGKLIEGQSMDSDGRKYFYSQIFVSPKPVVGMKTFSAYMKNNIIYPKIAQSNNIQGTVYVQFIVEETGLIADAKIYRKLGYGCDEEALRVLYGSPKWISGQRRGVNTKVKLILPVLFELN